jgi:hypothetical protein
MIKALAVYANHWFLKIQHLNRSKTWSVIMCLSVLVYIYIYS